MAVNVSIQEANDPFHSDGSRRHNNVVIQIVSGYRNGEFISYAGFPVRWPTIGSAQRWAIETGYTVVDN